MSSASLTNRFGATTATDRYVVCMHNAITTSHKKLSTTENHTKQITMSTTMSNSVLLAPSPVAPVYDFMYYLKGAAAGGICCSVTHGALTPVDVVKTRVQLDSAKVSTVLLLVDHVLHEVSALDAIILLYSSNSVIIFRNNHLHTAEYPP